MKLIKLNPNNQRYLIDKYKRNFRSTWKDLGDKFGFSWSAIRVNFWQRCRPMPIEMFEEFSKVLDKNESNKIEKDSEVIDGKIIRRHIKKRNSKSTVRTIRKIYGNNFFKKIGKLGGRRQRFFWTKEKLLNQSLFGKDGGKKRIKGIPLNHAEKFLSRENNKFGLIYKNNFFINDDLNFDFVYFSGKRIICVEETTLDPFRGLSYFLEKRKKLNKEIPFILTYNKIRPDVLSVLLDNNILPIEMKFRNKLLPEIIKGKISTKRLKKTLGENIALYADFWKSFSKHNSIREFEKKFNHSEMLLHKSLKIAGFKPLGRKIIETKRGFNYVTDNFLRLNGNEIAVITSDCNSRGSLLYTFYKHASFGILFRNAAKVPVKVLSVIFDFSKTLTSEGLSNPKILWDKNCDYKITVNEDSLKDLKSKIITTLDR